MKIKNHFLKTLALVITVLLFFLIGTTNAQRLAKSYIKESTKNVDTVSYIVKYKIRSASTFTYRSSDSTLSNVKLESKQITTYNRAGNGVISLSENGNGKAISKTESKFDQRNNLIESISYDSLNKVSYSSKYYYDDLNRLSESTTLQQLYFYTYKPEDTDKYSSYTYRSKYDANGNVIEYVNDSSGTVIYRIVSKYDLKNRVVYTEQYDHKALQSIVTYVYDSKGAYRLTQESYQTASKTQCSPSKNRTVEKIDYKGNMLSSISTSEENGVGSTTKTTYEYKYDKDKLLSLKTLLKPMAMGILLNQQVYKHINMIKMGI